MASKAKKAVHTSKSKGTTDFLLIALLLLLTFIVYYKSLNNNFLTNWDDHQYVIHNDDIKKISGTNLKKMFTTYYIGNYQPLTILSYAIDYHFWELNPKGYKTINLLLHLLNTLLVFIICKKISNKQSVGLITATVFALHPLHVESVSWVSERKDVLYTAFYLGAILFYLKYLTEKHYKHLLVVVVLFICSALSKSAAITLPLVLVLIQWYLSKEKIDYKSFWPAILFFAISIVFGLVALDSQKEAGATNMGPSFPLSDRPFLIAYSIAFYLVKFIAPVNLCAMYYYPHKTSAMLPIEYYGAALVLLVLIFVVVKTKVLQREIIFGALFFLFSLSLTIQLIPIGRTIAADRYSYVPFIGLGFIIGNLYNYYGFHRKVVSGILITLFTIFSIITYQRTLIWKDVITVFTDVIEKNPTTAHAYWVRAAVESDMKDYKNAMADFNKGISFDSTFAEAFNNRGNISYNLNDYETAIRDYTKAIELDPKYQLPYNNRASCKRNMKDYKGALEDYTKAVENDTAFFVAFHNRGLVKYNLQDYKGAIEDFNRTIQLKPDYPDAYSNRGVSNYYLKNYEPAIKDYNKAIELNSNYSEAYNNRAAVKFYMNDRKGACDDWQKALQLNFPGAKQMLETYCK